MVLPWTSVGDERLTLPVLLVVEIVSAGSRIHDTVTKRAVDAAAGIPAYWIVDPPAGEATALRLDDRGIYQPTAQGPALHLEWPLSVDLDLAALARRPELRSS